MNKQITPQANKVRPFYRSLLFYFAVLGLIFLIWAWRDSSTHKSLFVYNGRWGYYSSLQQHGAVEFSDNIIRVMHVKSLHVRRTKNHLFIFSKLGFVFPDAITPIENFFGEKSIRIAHWLILFVYTFVWSAILYAWQRYRSKVFKRN